MSQSASGDRINYSLRPAKSVERKMLCNIFSKLYNFGPIDGYRYIGFGSKYFSDFKLFHRALNISEMISIEKDESNAEKYLFNKPLDCITLKFGESNEALLDTASSKKTITWLDYDYAINETMLTDIAILLEGVVSGSMILCTYNSIAPKIRQLKDEFRDSERQDHESLLKLKLEKATSAELIPRDMPQNRLSKSSVYSNIVRGIFANKIVSILNSKNAALSSGDKWIYSQVLYFNYKDGSDMSTVGWIFYQKKDSEKYVSCRFEQLPYFRDGKEAYEISIPNLTLKEVSFLQAHMPLTKTLNETLNSMNLFSEGEIAAYSKIYKYFPTFTDIELA